MKASDVRVEEVTLQATIGSMSGAKLEARKDAKEIEHTTRFFCASRSSGTHFSDMLVDIYQGKQCKAGLKFVGVCIVLSYHQWKRDRCPAACYRSMTTMHGIIRRTDTTLTMNS